MCDLAQSMRSSSKHTEHLVAELDKEIKRLKQTRDTHRGEDVDKLEVIYHWQRVSSSSTKPMRKYWFDSLFSEPRKRNFQSPCQGDHCLGAPKEASSSGEGEYR